ncbi:methyltransferase domain-containing protein [Pannonibacter sp. Pt2]|uniref:Methyltransferase domain-containing protein n=1 Tax=Pannonibacter anstelovis TaxID=3121537 RepID=A0ABU7ZPD2_9HYPH
MLSPESQNDGSLSTRISMFPSQRANYIPALRLFTKSASRSTFLAKFSRFVNKFLYRFGIGALLNRYDNSFTLYSSHSDAMLYRNYDAAEIFCNFGSGAFHHRRWKNYDYPGQSSYYKAIQGEDGVDFHGIDLCAPGLTVPEESESVSLIYCSHTLEHLETDGALGFLRECARILKRGGVMRLALPNTTNDFRILRLMDLQENAPEQWKEDLLKDAVPHIIPVAGDALNIAEASRLAKDVNFEAAEFYRVSVERGVDVSFSGANPERHISFWSYESLVSLAPELGFRFVIPCYQGSSVAAPFRNTSVFDTTAPHFSFYVELVK